MIVSGSAPTPEISILTGDDGGFVVALPDGEFVASLQTARGYVARAVLNTHELSSPFLFRLPVDKPQESFMTEGIASISNDIHSNLASLGSVSNDSPHELWESPEPAKVIASLPGSPGVPSGPGVSSSSLIVRGTEPFVRPPRSRTLLESILGQDERARILDTDVVPWRMICSLFIKGKSGAALGTGWFAGPRTIVTAGHCVYHPQMGGWATEIRIAPGRDSKREPFGALASKRFSTTDRWFHSLDPDFDYAAIHLGPEAEAITAKTGWFSTVVMNDAGLLKQRVNVSGYPGDKGFGALQGTEQWFHAKQIVYVTPRRIYYDVDTMGGQSGAPAWVDTSDGPRVVGIHAYGVGGATSIGLAANSAPRITEDVLGVIGGWLSKG